MQVPNIPIARDFKEITRHGSTLFPIGVYKTQLSRNVLGYVPLHWHDEIQFCLVTKGFVSFTVNQSIYNIEEENGIFINSGYLHSAKPYNSENKDSEYICFDISPSFLSGSSKNIIHEKYVEPFLKSSSNSAIALNASIPWQKKVLSTLDNLFRVYINNEFGFELDMHSKLLSIWHLIITNTPNYINEVNTNTFAENNRIKEMLSYIHQNYKQKITLDDVAKAANISRSECCRFFKRMIKSTPFEYLISYRINQSMLLLKNSSLSITEIAEEVGFGSVSYYIEKFRKHTNYTPKEFRNYCITPSENVD